jgi:hypothetical protein
VWADGADYSSTREFEYMTPKKQAQQPQRRVHSLTTELLDKSREAALSAVQIFNNPLIRFKSETYIVLMIIAWTYLLHAYYRKSRIEYRYFRQTKTRRKFDRTQRGALKYWELERCLNDSNCPLDRETVINLRFLIGLRHEIEHQMTMHLDNRLSGRYQACALNYNHYAKTLFSGKQGIDNELCYAIQFIELSHQQAQGIPIKDDVPPRLLAYIIAFDTELTPSEYNSERFSYRLVFTKRVVGNPNTADRVIEFLDPNSEAAKAVEKEYWVKKEVERPKFGAKTIVMAMRKEGFRKFNISHHTNLWKALDAQKPTKGYGCQLGPQWWWYEHWLEKVRQHCRENAANYQ